MWLINVKMSQDRKHYVKWDIPEQSGQPGQDRNRPESPSERYVYSNTFEESFNEPSYSDTFIDDPYSDTFVNDSTTIATVSRSKAKELVGFHGGSVIRPKRSDHSVSFDDSETSIPEATHLETARNVTDALETVLEIDYDQSQTLDLDTQISNTHPPASYTDTFESSDRTRLDSQYDYTYDFTQETAPTHSDSESFTESLASRTKSVTRGKSFFTDEDDSLLDRSFIAPDYNGKSLTDEESDTDDDTYNDDYSYTFEATDTVTTSYIPASDLMADGQLTGEEAKKAAQAERNFTRKVLDRLRGTPANYSQLQTLPPDPRDLAPVEDDYLKHFCKKKVKQLKARKQRSPVNTTKQPVTQHKSTVQNMDATTISDYGIPESKMERLRIQNILSAMKKAATEDIHEPSKCSECRELKTALDSEDAERRFVTSHSMRLKNKVMDAKVEDHLLKMNSISMIADIARDLPRHGEKPEKILDRLFEPLLGKNVMR